MLLLPPSRLQWQAQHHVLHFGGASPHRKRAASASLLRATECLFRACELADRLRFVNEIANDAGFEALVSHVASFKLLRMTWTRVLGRAMRLLTW